MSDDYEDDDLDYDGWCVDCDDDHGVIQDDEDWLCTECLLVRYHKLAEENQRLAAEVERLRPREMTLEEIADVLNKHRFRGQNWLVLDDKGVVGERKGLLTFEATAIAEKLLREKEAQ